MTPPDRTLTTGPQPGESPKARVDRELSELLEEIRVALPGLELLFGFLLVLPFQAGFGDLTGMERNVYLACFLSTAAAAALLIAPSAHHRLRFRSVDKEQLLFDSNRQVIAGLVLVTISIALAMYLVVSVIVDTTWAALLAGAIGGWYSLWWFAFPRLRRQRRAE